MFVSHVKHIEFTCKEMWYINKIAIVSHMLHLDPLTFNTHLMIKAQLTNMF